MDPILFSSVGEVVAAEGALFVGVGHANRSASGVLERPDESRGPHDHDRAAEAAGKDGAAKESEGEAVVPAEAPPLHYEMMLYDQFPEPLSEPQRMAFQRHVAQAVRKYDVLCRTSGLIRQGLASLERLVARLRDQRDALLQRQHEGASTKAEIGVPPAKIPKGDDGGDGGGTETATAVAVTATGGGGGVDAPHAAAPARRPNRFGGLLRSAVFTGMQKVLDAAKKEEAVKYAQVAESRERIARETQLKLLAEDLATQEAVLSPLLEKLDKCLAMEKEAEAAAVVLLQLLADMFTQESRYASSFTLRAVDATAVAALRSVKEEQPQRKHLPTASLTFEVPFMPAVCTAEVEELLRGQVEETLPAYTAFRARIKPTLDVLEEEEEARRAKRLDDLMSVIGVTSMDVPSGQTEALLTAAGPGALLGAPSSAGGFGSGLLGNVGERQAAGVPPRRIQAGFGVSDSDGEDGESEDSLEGLGARTRADPAPSSSEGDALAHARGGEGPSLAGVKRGREEAEAGGEATAVNAAADRDQRDRQLIQSALSALDDFDAMF